MAKEKKTVFLHQPEYPGGVKAMSAFLTENLKYPKSAMEAGIEGTVVVEYDIDYKGKVIATRVLKTLSPECDEEASRVVKLLKFEVPRNRGLHVIFHKKAHIQFKKPAAVPVPVQPAVQYVYTTVAENPQPEPPATPAAPVYTYTVTLG